MRIRHIAIAGAVCAALTAVEPVSAQTTQARGAGARTEQRTPSRPAPPPAPGQTFKECRNCPEMMVGGNVAVQLKPEAR
jgi:hypothetical protein